MQDIANPSLGNRHAQHSFAQIPDVHMVRSQFDRSSTLKTTFNADYLVPIFVDEILPGDTMNLTAHTFGRLATQIVPILDNMYLDFFFFFVPNRLVMDGWEQFMGSQHNPGPTLEVLAMPTLDITGHAIATNSIYDHFGFPTGVTPITGHMPIHPLPLRGYNLIWNEWFRDQNLQNSVVVHTDQGPDPFGDYTLLKRNKRPDYFTSALPWAQKFQPPVLSFGGTAPVISNNTDVELYNITMASSQKLRAAASSNTLSIGGTGYGAGQNVQFGTNTGLVANLAAASGITINDFRVAIMTQSLQELDARGGTRYVEILRAHFNVISPDFRLQRPEYLGGGEAKIMSHPVAQTSSTDAETPQGNLAGFATISSQGSSQIGFTKSFVEHGYVIGLCAMRADLTYQQGLNRTWLRTTRYDYFWPKLQELGEQTIYNAELYWTGDATTDKVAFGYQERYGEYRYKPSEIHGEFRSQYAQSLDYWHMAEEFGSRPALNSTFIQSSTPAARAQAVTNDINVILDAFFQVKHARPMLTYAVPATLGRF